MNSEIDVNLLVSVYNERLVALTSQNVILEARIKSLIKDYTEEKNKLMLANLELQRKLDSSSEETSSKKPPKIEKSDYEE